VLTHRFVKHHLGRIGVKAHILQLRPSRGL
jgi:hypothetical protein